MGKVYIVKSVLICESWYCVENTLGVFATKEEAEKFVSHCSTIKNLITMILIIRSKNGKWGRLTIIIKI